MRFRMTRRSHAAMTAAHTLAAAIAVAACSSGSQAEDAETEHATQAAEAISLAPDASLPITKTATPRTLGGVTLGETLDVVQLRCTKAGLTCTRRSRTVRGVAYERLHIALPTGDLSRVIAVAKNGVVMGLRGTYRGASSTRYDALAKTYGNAGTRDANGSVWTWTGTRAELSRNQSVLLLVATDTAANLKMAMPARLLPTRLATLNPSTKLTNVPVDPIAPAQTTAQTIGVTFTIDSLTCFDEDDPTSLFWGDSPDLYLTGLHTTGGDGQPWPAASAVEKSYGDIESGDTVSVNMPIFDASDTRRFVSTGEFVGFHAVLIEEDDTPGGNDEIDFVDKVISFDTALAQKGSTVSGKLEFEGDGAAYELAYHYTVGTPTALGSQYNVFGNVSPQPWAGKYTWTVDGATNAASLTFAAPNATFPNGQLVGTWTENGSVFSIVPRRQLGTFFDFYLVPPGQTAQPSTRHMVGYLVGSGTNLAIAGTSYGATKTGFVMKRTP